MNPLVIAIDPASSRLAFVAKHPLLPTYTIAKYNLAPARQAYRPDNCGEAWDVTLEFVEAARKMATPRSPLYAFVEDALVGVNVKSTIKQSYVNGAVQACLMKTGCQIELVNVKAWKRVVCGNGNASKDEVARTIKAQAPKLASVIGSDQDLFDAAAICLYGSRKFGERLA